MGERRQREGGTGKAKRQGKETNKGREGEEGGDEEKGGLTLVTAVAQLGPCGLTMDEVMTRTFLETGERG